MMEGGVMYEVIYASVVSLAMVLVTVTLHF